MYTASTGLTFFAPKTMFPLPYTTIRLCPLHPLVWPLCIKDNVPSTIYHYSTVSTASPRVTFHTQPDIYKCTWCLHHTFTCRNRCTFFIRSTVSLSFSLLLYFYHYVQLHPQGQSCFRFIIWCHGTGGIAVVVCLGCLVEVFWALILDGVGYRCTGLGLFITWSISTVSLSKSMPSYWIEVFTFQGNLPVLIGFSLVLDLVKWTFLGTLLGYDLNSSGNVGTWEWWGTLQGTTQKNAGNVGIWWWGLWP